ncbi:unnamed protein product [Closterium sp. NIES-65]|nr:unnamed protein product [Closterium sp. NIES-65]
MLTRSTRIIFASLFFPDCADYILDIETRREFFLSLALYINENGCLNNDKYEYDLACDVAEAIARALWDDNNRTRDQYDVAANAVADAPDVATG